MTKLIKFLKENKQKIINEAKSMKKNIILT